MNHITEGIDFGKGNISYNDLYIEENESLEKQIMNLKEDMLQVEYENGKIILDVGWYPEFNTNGQFKIVIIKNYDWSNPIYEKEASLFTLKRELVKVSTMLR